MNRMSAFETFPRITPFLWFDSNAEEAVEFYLSVFRNSRRLDRVDNAGGGPAPGDAGQSAAPALAMSRPALEPSSDQIKDALCAIRDSYAHATEAIHALVAAFVRDRF